MDLPKPYYPFPIKKKPKPVRRKDERGNRHERGYDTAWDKLRTWYAAKHPLCESCLRRNHITPMKDVDHIEPFCGLEDPNRLNPANLQSLCRPCHNKKTRSQ